MGRVIVAGRSPNAQMCWSAAVSCNMTLSEKALSLQTGIQSSSTTSACSTSSSPSSLSLCRSSQTTSMQRSCWGLLYQELRRSHTNGLDIHTCKLFIFVFYLPANSLNQVMSKYSSLQDYTALELITKRGMLVLSKSMWTSRIPLQSSLRRASS
jgi:hypothetical protein